MSLRLEVWDAPGAASPVKKIESPAFIEASGKKTLRGVGNGRMVIDEDFEDLPLITSADPDDESQDVASMVRVWDDDEHIQDWIVEPAPEQLDEDGLMELGGYDVKGVFAWAYVEAFDWDGSNDFTTVQPDWDYGAESILRNGDFESSSVTPKSFELTVRATGGTYTISDGTDTTSAIAFDAEAATIETRIQTDLGLIDDIVIASIGPGIFSMTMVAPQFGVNLSVNGDSLTNTTYLLDVDATGGTYTISDGTDTTSAIAFDASAATVETRITTDIAAVNTVTVTDLGIEGYEIEITDPGLGVELTINTGSLTGGTATLTEVDLVEINTSEEGGLSPNSWDRAKALARGVSINTGYYDDFRVSDDQNHTPGGQYSLLIDPGPVGVRSNRNAGCQQVLSVVPGGLYQASVWIYPTSGADEFRLGIFGIGEEWIAFDPSVSGATLIPNTWNELAIDDLIIPDGVTEVIFRISCTNVGPSNPSRFYVDDGVFYPGLPMSTIGRILYDQRDHMDLRGALPFISLDFTEAVDSAGNAWSDTHRVKLRHGMRQSSVIQMVEQLGYDVRLVVDDYDACTYLLQVYNPGTSDADSMGITPTDDSPSILLGQGGVAGSATRRHSAWNAVQVLGDDGVTSRAESAASEGAMGRREHFLFDEETEPPTRASELLSDGLNQGLVNGITMAAGPWPLPFHDFDVGWFLDWDLADGSGKTEQRVGAISYQETDEVGLTYTVFPDKETFSGQGAINEGVRRLLEKEEFPVQIPDSPGTSGVGGGGMAHVLIVSESEPAEIQEKADFVVPDQNSAQRLQDAFDTIAAIADRVWSIWMAGVFDFDDDVTGPAGAWIRGLGYEQEQLET